MGTALTGSSVASTYDALLKITDNGPVGGTAKVVTDGLGNDSCFKLGTTSAEFTGALGLDAGTVAAPGLYLEGETGTGLYRIGANNHGYAVSGSKVLDIASTGLSVTGTLGATGAISTGSGVSTDGAIKSFYSGSGPGITLENTSDTSGTFFAAFRKASGASIGSITRVTTTDAVAFNTTSDARRKENVRDLTAADSGRIIDGLRPRWFDWKDSDENGKGIMGFVAQEAYAVDPSISKTGAVTKGDDGEEITQQWAMDAAKLVPVLTAEIKSLRARVAALEAA